jgi:hypothetical protein
MSPSERINQFEREVAELCERHGVALGATFENRGAGSVPLMKAFAYDDARQTCLASREVETIKPRREKP